MTQLAQKIRSLPASPGVYQYFDAAGRLLYVGKAKSLKARVKSYFAFTPVLGPAPKLSPRIARMIGETVEMATILVESENDALILENSLIKQLRPKYNILLRDDKTYPYIYVDLSEPYPRPEITRKVVKGRHIRYYGPYASGGRDLIETMYELFPLVQKKNCIAGKKVCLFYQIGRCLGPCEGKITPEAYREILDDALAMLTHKERALRALRKRMDHLAEEMRFEEAAAIRDRISGIEKSAVSSPIDLATRENFDLFAVTGDDSRVCVVKMFVREGRVASSTHHFVRASEGYDPAEIYPQALLDFYGVDTPVGAERIYVAHPFDASEAVEGVIAARAGRKVPIAVPARGDKKRLAELALANGTQLLALERTKTARDETTADELARMLSLAARPYRIEIFDNSHFQGDTPVGAMVVWDNGGWDKPSYRHYTLTTTDDYHQMREMLTRRVESFATNPPPDLWVLDGGKTLVTLARDILASVGVTLDVIGVAKEKNDGKARRAKGGAADTISTAVELFRLPESDARLQFLQRLRDEAHRFAISFHRAQKVKKDKLVSMLDLSGIGPAKVKKMIGYFGSFEAAGRGSPEEYRALFGPREGQRIYDTLASNDFFIKNGYDPDN